MQRTLSDRQIERLARRRAGSRAGWFIHAGVYLLVNLLLGALALQAGRTWAIYPAAAWGLGLAIHGLVTFLRTDGCGLFERLVDRERNRLALQRDPW